MEPAPNFEHPELVRRYGSWVRVQVEFYDFLYAHAGLPPERFNKKALEGALKSGGFADGAALYEDAIKGIEAAFSTVGAAWRHFCEREGVSV